MMTRKLFITSTWLALALCALAASAGAQTHDDHWMWRHDDDGRRLEVSVYGKVEFAEDYSDAASIPADSELRVVDTRTPSVARRYVVTRDGAGGLRRDYTVNQQVRPFDDEARAWLRGVLSQATRQGGLDARNRVRRILARGGVRALTEEIGQIKGDYARRIYYDELLRADGVREGDLRDAIGNASRGITSDYERAQLLIHAAPNYVGKASLHAAYFEALDRLGSDYERHRVLSAILKKHNPGRDALLRMAQSASKIGSDYEKASFLIEAAPSFQPDATLRAAFAQAMATIGSDYERGRVQSKLIKLNY